jgi:tight adherence protein C
MSGLLSILVSALVAATVVLVVIGLWPDILPASPRSGERGQRRKEALEGNRLFRRAEPLLRLLSGAVDPFCPKRLNAKADDLMAKTGFALGLDGKDLVALSLLMAGICGASGGVFLEWLGKGPGAGVTLGAIFGAAFFWLKFQDVAKRRLIIIARGLPGVLDLVVLAMASGLDFTGAVQQVSGRLDPQNPIRFELLHLLQKLALGWSRRQALEALAERVPILPVRQFTNAIIQAEKRGTPLKEVLATQAEVMRTKRSQHAEQAAARAAVLILGPLMLIFACVFAIILGPFVVKYLRGDLF